MHAWLGDLPPRGELRILAAVVAAAALLLLAMLLLPGRTYIAKYIQDMMVFLDGSHRILDGQVPNRDFHTPLGPLAFLLPAFGLWLGASLGMMMPLATAAFAVILVPLLVYVAGSRLPLVPALLFSLFFLLLAISPLNPGETPATVSFAMFYNRFCWALLSVLFLLVLPRRDGLGSASLDGAVIAAILLIMFYMKISYAVFGLPFAAALIAFPHARKAALVGLGITAAGLVVVEVFWGATATYLADIAAAGRASSVVRGSLFGVGSVLLQNLGAIFLLAAALLLGYISGARRLYLLLSLYMAGAGILLINQNAQVAGIMTLAPAALVALYAPRRAERAAPAGSVAYAPVVLVAALMVQPAAAAAASLAYHGIKAARPAADGPYAASLDGMVTQEGRQVENGRGSEALPLAYRSGQADLYLLNLSRHAQYRQSLAQSEYLRTVQDGVRLIEHDPRLTGRVFALDFANPFNALLGRPAPRGGDAWYHADRTLSMARHPSAQDVFAEVDVVMVPKAPNEWNSAQLLQRLYGPYVTSRFQLVAESTYWRAYRRAETR